MQNEPNREPVIAEVSDLNGVLPPAQSEEGERDPIRFRILKHFGVIGEAYQHREIELNYVAWNDGYAKFDIRAWDRIHTHMSKGITLKTDEAEALRDILNTIDFSRYRYHKDEDAQTEQGSADDPAENEPAPSETIAAEE